MADMEMPYRALGRCGTKVSALGLGGWLTFGHRVSDHDTVVRIMKAAWEAGINFFDSADIYAKGDSEQAMGAFLRELPRHELVISSKVFWPMSSDVNDRGLSRKHIHESIEKTLRRLGTDYLDIYFCHRFDPDTPVEETARAMDDLVHQGKILYWGTSEWSAAELREACGLCRQWNLYRPQVEQPEYNLLRRRRFERSLLPVLTDEGMGTVTWSPLCMGLLTGKYDDGMPPDSRMATEEWLQPGRYTEAALSRVRQFKAQADALGCTRAQLAIAWVAAQPGVSSVILGASSLKQLEENLQAVTVQITPQCLQALDDLFPIAEAP